MPHKIKIKNAIDMALIRKQLLLSDLIKVLEKQGIHVILRQNEAGLLYGITYVDHSTKCVFNGSALGKQYSAKTIQERCLQGVSVGQKTALQLAEKQLTPQQQPDAQKDIKPTISKAWESAEQTIKMPDIGKTLDALVQPEHTTDYLPYQLKKKKKKRNVFPITNKNFERWLYRQGKTNRR